MFNRFSTEIDILIQTIINNWIQIKTTLINGSSGDPFNDVYYREHAIKNLRPPIIAYFL